MTNFVTEAKRFGIPAPYGSSFATDGDYIVAWPNGGFYTENVREDRLCVDGCPDCRDFRNAVREATAEEATRLADFEREEQHAVEAAVEFEDHLNLLPATRLSVLAADALNVAIGLAHAAFDEARANGMTNSLRAEGVGCALNRPQQDEDIFAAIFGSDSPFVPDLDDDEFPY